MERSDKEAESASASIGSAPPFRGVGPGEVRAGVFVALPAVLADFGLDASRFSSKLDCRPICWPI